MLVVSTLSTAVSANTPFEESMARAEPAFQKDTAADTCTDSTLHILHHAESIAPDKHTYLAHLYFYLGNCYDHISKEPGKKPE